VAQEEFNSDHSCTVKHAKMFD
jgi:hypothetical protein